jgi:uncharacterized protein YceK
MKRLVLVLSLSAAALSGCAQLKEASSNGQAHAGSTAVEAQRTYPYNSTGW